MLSLNQFALSDSATLELVSPSGDKLLIDCPKGGQDSETGKPLQVPVTIDLIRSDSQEATEFSHKRQNERLRQVGHKRKVTMPTAKELAEDQLNLIVFCTRGWQGFSLDDGQEMPCTPANVRKVYADPRFTWIRDQVGGFISDEANFLGNSQTS